MKEYNIKSLVSHSLTTKKSDLLAKKPKTSLEELRQQAGIINTVVQPLVTMYEVRIGAQAGTQ